MNADVTAGWVLLGIAVIWVLGAIVGEVMRYASRRADWILATSLDPRPDYEANVTKLNAQGREANR